MRCALDVNILLYASDTALALATPPPGRFWVTVHGVMEGVPAS